MHARMHVVEQMIAQAEAKLGMATGSMILLANFALAHGIYRGHNEDTWARTLALAAEVLHGYLLYGALCTMPVTHNTAPVARCVLHNICCMLHVTRDPVAGMGTVDTTVPTCDLCWSRIRPQPPATMDHAIHRRAVLAHRTGAAWTCRLRVLQQL